MELLNSPDSSNEDRKRVQNLLLAIQRDPTNWPFIPQWLTNPQVQVQFFGAQCLLIRINRDWETLEEAEQVQLREMIVTTILTQSNLTTAARNKMEGSLVKVMEKAFVSGWWKDPISDLLNSEIVNFNLLAQIAASDSSGKSSYAWHHEIRAHGNKIIEIISKQGKFDQVAVLNCVKNWTNFGAFNFNQIERILPILTLNFDEEIEAVVDCLIEICELATRDSAEEARKARYLIPFCLKLASQKEEEETVDPSIVTKLAASLAEECANFFIETCHQEESQKFLGLLLNLTKSDDGIVGVDDQSTQMTLNSWYLLTEAVEGDCPASNSLILVSLFAKSLAPILLEKATLPTPQIWSKLPRDLQQQFLQIRREFLDTLLYIQRALKTLKAPNLLLELLFSDLKRLENHPNAKTHIETRLRALIIVAEEEDSCDFDEETGESLSWTPAWQHLASLIFSSPFITQDAINAKLAISLIGSLLPLMKGTGAADEAVKMLLGQLQSNVLVREECLGALQQAADAEVPLLTDPQIISNLLLSFLSADSTDSNSRPKLLKLLSRLISDLSDESQRWTAFNSLIQSCSQNHSELAQVLRSSFTFKSENLLTAPSPFKSCLQELKLTCDLSGGEALLAAWLSLSGSNFFPIFESESVDPWEFLVSYLNSNDPNMIVLGCKLLAAWVYGMSRVNPGHCLKLLETVTTNYILCIPDPPEDALEAILDSWIHLIKQTPSESPVVFNLYTWTLHRISIGQLSVPLLRSLARFLCSLLEFNLLKESEQLFPIVQIVFSVGISGKIGRSGIEILARVLYDISLQQPNFFRSALNQLTNSESFSASLNSNDKRAFLRNVGAAHTMRKFKTVIVEFCLQSRGITPE